MRDHPTGHDWKILAGMWGARMDLGHRKMLIEMFQKLLKDVPEWNETMAKQHTDNIADRCSWFRDLVAAVFVSSVKILSAVRLSSDSKKMSVKLPTNEIFIHTCYSNAAKDLYRDPYIFSENQSEHARNDKLYERFSTCVETSVKELIPVQQILQTYMTSGTDEYIDGEEPDLQDENIEEYDENDQQHIGDMEEGMEEGMGEGMGEQQYQEEMHDDHYQEAPQESPDPFQNEFKTIRSNSQQVHEGPEDGEELFSDAADSRSKKLAY